MGNIGWRQGVIAVGAVAAAGVMLAKKFSGPTMPEDQTAFCQVIAGAAGAYAAAAGNEFQQESAARSRAQALARTRVVASWVGEVERVESSVKGATLEVKLPCKTSTSMKTWSNFVSDSDNTIIPQASPLYMRVAGLSRGQQVRFSAETIPSQETGLRESSVTTRGSMSEPEFIVRFTDVVASE